MTTEKSDDNKHEAKEEPYLPYGPDFVGCYNCTGAKTQYMCNFPMHGCKLCETYGKGDGWLSANYAQGSGRTVSIVSKRQDGTEVTETFTPPAYVCLHCRDTKKATYSIWDASIADRSYSDNNAHSMPRITVACHKCCPMVHKSERAAGEALYFAKKNKKPEAPTGTTNTTTPAK